MGVFSLAPDLSGYPTFAGLLADYQTRNGLPSATQDDMLARVMGPMQGFLKQLALGTVGETLGLGVSLGVRRYTIAAPGAVVGDRLVIALGGAPGNGTVQDAYVPAANTVSVGILVPALALGAVVAVPVVIYKVT